MNREQPPAPKSPFALPHDPELIERGFAAGKMITLIKDVPFEVWEHLAQALDIPVADVPELRQYDFYILAFAADGRVQVFIEENGKKIHNLRISEDDLKKAFTVQT